MSETYTTENMARLLMISERRVQQLTQQKILPQVSRGRYDLAPTIQAYVRWLNERIKSGDEADLQKEKALLTKAQREKAEIELGIMRNDVHKGEDVMRVWTLNVVNARSRMLSLPSKLSPMLVNLQDVQEIQDILKGGVHEALEEIGDYNAKRISSVEVMEDE